jgi:hypothetical protein
MIDEKLEGVFSEVVRRNPGEAEFHQAVREVFESLGPVMAKHPELGGLGVAHDHHGGGAVVERAAVARGDDAVGAEHRVEL